MTAAQMEVLFVLGVSYLVMRDRKYRGAMIQSKVWIFLSVILWIMAFMINYFQFILENINLKRAEVIGNILLIGGETAVVVLIFVMLEFINRGPERPMPSVLEPCEKRGRGNRAQRSRREGVYAAAWSGVEPAVCAHGEYI